MVIIKFSRWLAGGISALLLASLILVGSFRSVNSEPTSGSTKAIPIINEKGKQTAVLAGGCFWGMEAVFENLKGVSNAVSGYTGSDSKNVNYEAVSTGQTGYAEAIKITYDPAQISYTQLLKVYFLVAHDPTQLNRQYPDTGTQYRSAIFFANKDQQQIAQTYINQLSQSQTFSQPVVTQLAPLKEFYEAESYHQNFIARNPTHPYVVVHDLPKLRHLQQQFPELYRK
jgi:peptide-methionine (S)-S-oxide reductase